MKKLIIAAALVVTLAIIGSASSRAQIIIPPGQQIVCVLHCHGLIFIRLANGTVIEVPEDTHGQATFQSVAVPHRGGGVGSEFVPVDISVSGNNPTAGAYNFTYDASRPVSNSTVYATDEAVAAGSEFPAISNVYANITGTLESFPGTFTNVTECHMQATINSFNPHQNETYTFVNDVEFTDDDPDGDGLHVTFTILAGSTVTLN